MSGSAAVRSSARYSSYRSTTTKTVDDGVTTTTTTVGGTDLAALTRIEDKMKLLQEDLEFERELRQRIEREKSELSVHLMQMSEKLEEATGTTETQGELNKRREAEMSKLRKLLEDVHLESEETAVQLRKKHQETVLDLQQQVEQLTKLKTKAEREKQKVQSEVYEMLAQVESISKEKLTYQRTIERLEQGTAEAAMRLEESVAVVGELGSQRAKLAAELSELQREYHDARTQIETLTHTRMQLAAQYEETRRSLEDEERRRTMSEQKVHTLELELETTRGHLDEESERRIDVERQLAKSQADFHTFKSKYEAEVQAHVDEVDEMRRKFSLRCQEYEEQLESMVTKCTNLEKHKTRLQSEIEVLILDLEKSTTEVHTLEKRCQQSEKLNTELSIRLEELTAVFESTKRELVVRTADLERVTAESDRLKAEREILVRDNKKLNEDLGETRIQLSDTTRRLQEVETELRRVEAEREEASQAYREAEALRRQEEAKCQRLGAELAQQRHEFEVRLVQKDEEYETLRKQTQIELDQMSQRVADAEAKVKTEVARIKKKMQLTITELEMSLDVSNKKIIDLQKIVKTQSLQITEIQARYEEVQIQIQQTTDQLVVSQRRCQGLVGEIEELRAALEQAARGKRAAEQHAEETNAKLTESNTQISVLVASRTKLEADVTVLKHDCEETIKELRICDERLQRVLVELKTARDHLTEERERSAKLDVVKKSLEVEVRNLQIRIEEVEVSALAGTKRAITKLESRVRDLEIEIDEERRRHAETLKVSRKKELRIKELLTQIEEDQCTIAVLNDSVEKLAEKMKMYKRQLNEQEGVSQQSLSRVRRFQRELEAAEERADCAESSLSMIRAKHRTWVTTSSSTSHQGVMISHEETTAHTGF